MIRSKKGLERETIIELIIFIILFFIAFKIGAGFLGYFTEKPEIGTVKSVQALRIEIGTLEQKESRTVPVFIDENHVIQGFFKDNTIKPTACKPKLKGEKPKACLCVCTESTCDQIKKEVEDCTKVDFELKEEYTLTHKLDEEDNAILQNCVLTRLDEEETPISISCT